MYTGWEATLYTTSESTLMRNHTIVINVGSVFYDYLLSKYISKDFTPKRNHINVEVLLSSKSAAQLIQK